jgi:hypothetical protein
MNHLSGFPKNVTTAVLATENPELDTLIQMLEPNMSVHQNEQLNLHVQDSVNCRRMAQLAMGVSRLKLRKKGENDAMVLSWLSPL